MSKPDARQVMVNLLRATHDEMRFLMLEAKIQESSYEAAIAEAHKWTMEDLSREIDWFNQLREGAYEDARRFKAQKSQQWWDNLVTIFAGTDFVERRILDEKLKVVRKIWRAKYGRPKPVAEQDGDPVVSAELRL